MRFLPLTVLLLFALPVAAQEPMREVTADLDRDGSPETYALIENGRGTVDLVVDGRAGRRTAGDVAWTGGMPGQEPGLSLSPSGSVLLTSRNDSVGRDRWTLTLTLAYREGDLRVAGITYGWRDTLGPQTGWGGCDLNLLTGRGTVTGPGGEQGIVVPFPAPRLWEWREADLPQRLPAECFG
ncbi:hypothetical protein [Rubellimicrobium arenae]|uniref:hypothetical protein n=1 Tax=Rubellimicrobium arenae TaxID=2817372 RepID=UPI001B301CC8|nr:hypothetical protein [Rubellimicrobium arenae]